MALQDLLNTSSRFQNKIGISEERIEAIKPVIRNYIAYWREYPDMFIDFLQTGRDGEVPKDGLRFFFYQRVFLRISLRYRQVYAVFPRGFSKSFLAVLSLMIRCILYPGAKLFSSAGGKSQAAGILKEKVDELCQLVPALERELDLRPGKTRQSKDYCVFMFKNGSYFDNLVAGEKTRGKRRHAGVLEECATMDGSVLQEILIPVMAISRKALDGTKVADEALNKGQLYITTAGQKSSFAYQKLIAVLVKMIAEPRSAFILGGTYKILVLLGHYDKTFVQDQKKDDTFNEAAFGREYCSIWSGTVEDAFFNGENFDKSRQISQAEDEYSNRTAAGGYYVVSADLGRKGCDTVVTILKVTPQQVGEAYKSLVNIYTYSDMHFEDQCINLKKLYYNFKAEKLVIDGNGIGINMIDYLVKSQIDPATGVTYPPFGISNDEEGYYKRFYTPETERDAVYVIKANAPLNTEAHSNMQTQLNTGKLKFLIEERVAKAKLLETKIGQKMTPEQRNERLMPFKLTDILKDELMNLREENEGINIILKQANKRVKKDKFSALEYGLYYIRQKELSKKKKKKFNAKEWRFYN